MEDNPYRSPQTVDDCNERWDPMSVALFPVVLLIVLFYWPTVCWMDRPGGVDPPWWVAIPVQVAWTFFVTSALLVLSRIVWGY